MKKTLLIALGNVVIGVAAYLLIAAFASHLNDSYRQLG